MPDTKEHHSRRENTFLKREGRLLFQSYLRPLVNGKGFEFKEPNVADERRMNIVITYRRLRHVIELKNWRGPQAHQEGLRQLSDYLERHPEHLVYPYLLAVMDWYNRYVLSWELSKPTFCLTALERAYSRRPQRFQSRSGL